MTGIEFFLIFAGIAAILCSFVFSERLEKNDKENKNNITFSEEMIKEQVEKAVDNILDEKVEETEVKMDKISSEKIMAVGDYSENVLKDISKNHDEVMFLYGMLNDKEKEVKNAVRDVENVKRSINIIAKENQKNTYTDDKSDKEELIDKDLSENQEKSVDIVKEQEKNKVKKKEPKEFKISVKDPNAKNKGVALSHKEVRRNSNNNKQILDLYNKGVENVEIAKKLGLGVGEVRLVIDLYKNKK